MVKQTLTWRRDPSGERCMIITLPAHPAPHSLLSQLARFLQANPLPGVRDIVPAAHSLGIHYQPEVLWRIDHSLSPYNQLVNRLDAILSRFSPQEMEQGREMVIPVCYQGEYAPDLMAIAQHCGISPEEVISRHQQKVVDVLMLGFLPGHPYLGALDEIFTLPRRATPRLSVAKGSIGIANQMGVIYPLTSPGGWNLIGRTPLTLFSSERQPACLLQAGDRVRFRAIDEAEFKALEEMPYVA
ncbi:5-oxoprolinase subunit PxpB [Erwiniaceae bacterium L1_54_6]|nr:5-oxoprolinase subunit PxpB [Erwiniaceae bacterium L1_54_6]